MIQKIKEEQEAAKKIYFLSAAHGAIERTMRFHQEGELMISHAILNICHSALNDRFNRIKAGDTVVPLPKDWGEQIVEYLSQLKDSIDRDQSVYPALEKIMELTYSTTGPGYYTKSYIEHLKPS